MSARPSQPKPFGVFVPHDDGSVSLVSGERPADFLARYLGGCPGQTFEEDIAVIRAFLEDHDRTHRHAGPKAAGLLPLHEFFTPEFRDADASESAQVAA